MASRSTSRVPETASASSTSSRKTRSRKASTRRATGEELDHQINLDYARLHNGLEPELPEDEDFVGISRVPRPEYYLELRRLRAEMRRADKRTFPESFKASPPWVPDPEDDAPLARQEGDKAEKGDHKPMRAFKRMRVKVKSPLSEEFIRPEDEPEDEVISDLILNKTPPKFMNIPSEVRMEIYRYLLTVKKPIAVHGGWKQVYWTKDLQLSTSILRVCSIVHDEASMVLYGANTFLYRLRDPTFNGLYINNLAMDDESVVVDESESGSEYEEELEQDEDDEDDEDGPFDNDKESSINIDKYAHLFRNIAIEAEANRYSMATQNNMVAAINVLCKPDKSGSDKASRNIHTLTVRIMPILDRQQYPPQQGRFTFVDFFLPNSPVIQAIKSVDCQKLHVDILTRHTSRRSAHFTVRGSGSCRLTINRRHEQALSYFQNNKLAGAGDEAVRRRTAEMARRSTKAIDGLAKHIEEQCNQRDFDQETAMDIDSSDWLWLDPEDDAF